MGTKARADAITEKLPMKDDTDCDILHILLDKCGNCQFRTACLHEILTKYGGDPPKSFLTTFHTCDDDIRQDRLGKLMQNPPSNQAKDMATMARYCQTCENIQHCMVHIFQIYPAFRTAGSTQPFMERLEKCAHCDAFPYCIDIYMQDLGHTVDTLIEAVAGAFEACKIGYYGGD
jgi:hypothetical protein